MLPIGIYWLLPTSNTSGRSESMPDMISEAYGPLSAARAKGCVMTLGRDDFGLDELLADGLIRAMMRADHVEPETVRLLASAASARLAAGGEAAAKRRIAFNLTSDVNAAKPGRGFRDPCAAASC